MLQYSVRFYPVTMLNVLNNVLMQSKAFLSLIKKNSFLVFESLMKYFG
jgi:hypothetical protein